METQVDDMTGEELAFALERLRESGAIDVFTTPIAMKKNRSGQLITVLTNPNDIEKIRDLLWEHTTTLGVRIRIEPRFVLAREEINVCRHHGATCGARLQPEKMATNAARPSMQTSRELPKKKTFLSMWSRERFWNVSKREISTIKSHSR
jgi:uncharacterized protein (DUF111 family)